MARFDNLTALNNETNSVPSAIVNSTISPTLLPFQRPATTIMSFQAPSLPPGHAAILEMHANSKSNAIIYISVVLFLYVLGVSVVLIKYFRTERYEARLTRLFHDLMQRDHFFRVSRRRSSTVPPNNNNPTAEPTISIQLDASPTITFQVNGDAMDMESKL